MAGALTHEMVHCLDPRTRDRFVIFLWIDLIMIEIAKQRISHSIAGIADARIAQVDVGKSNMRPMVERSRVTLA